MRNRLQPSAERRAGPMIGPRQLQYLFPMTSNQFCQLPPSDTVKLELLDGDVIIMPRATPFHQYFLLQLAIILETWARAKNLGRVLPDTLMMLSGKWTPAPDLVFVARNHLRRVKKKRVEGPVDLAIEALSPGTKRIDRKDKFAAYAKYGVPWYWIVDLKARVLEEYELVEGKYANPLKAPFDEPFKPRLFPGLVIDLASLEW
jgi:Uma2 family endonuclease